MKKKQFTKDQVARKLGIQAYIIDGWEKQFGLEPFMKDGQKVYSRKHLSQLRSIKELLYEKGFSIDAAKNHLKNHTTLEGTTLLAASPLNFEKQQTTPSPLDMMIAQPKKTMPDERLIKVRAQLLQIKERLATLSKSL